MKKTLLIVAIAFMGFVSCSQSQSQSQAKGDGLLSIVYDDDLMRGAKEAFEAKDPVFMGLYEDFKNFVDTAHMKLDVISPPDMNSKLSPTRDPRDLMTLSPYWWPNPDTADGLPYVRHDGIRNPELYEYTVGEWCSVVAVATQDLAFMYYISGDETYAKKAADMLREWYINPDKGLNPNIAFAQFVPGLDYIRGTGLLAANDMTAAINAAKILEPSQSWTDKDEADMKDWAKAFLYWVEYSTQGQKEHEGSNNHAIWYEANRQALALYAGEHEYLAEIIEKYMYPQLSNQVGEDGSLPHEVARTLGLHYMTYHMSGVTRSAMVAHKIGIDDIWSHVGDNGRCMSMALDFVIPYWKAPETWPYQQIRPATVFNRPLILFQAGKLTGNQAYTDLAYEFGFTDYINFDNTPSAVGLMHYKLKK